MKKKLFALAASLGLVAGLGVAGAAPAQAYTNYAGQSIENSCQSPRSLEIWTGTRTGSITRHFIAPCVKWKTATTASNAPQNFVVPAGYTARWVYQLDYNLHIVSGGSYGKVVGMNPGDDKFVLLVRS